MKWISPLTFVLIAAAACITVLLVKELKPTSGSAFIIFAAWLVLPYVLMSVVLVLLRRKGAVSAHWYIVAALTSIGGILFMSDVMFWHTDAQGGIAVLMTPILQGVVSALLLVIASWVSRNARA